MNTKERLGAIVMLLLQDDFEGAKALAREIEIDFESGKPVAKEKSGNVGVYRMGDQGPVYIRRHGPGLRLE